MPPNVLSRSCPAACRFVVAPVLLCLLAGGCQTMDQDELAWQALHAVDVAQTLNAASDPCYMEKSWLTKRMIGEQPSDAGVILWGIGSALVHKWVADQLEQRDAPRWAQTVWSYGTITHTGYAVMTNHENGVRPWGENENHDGCYR